MQSHIDHEHLVETLAAADETYSPSDEFTDSSVLKVKADLDLLQKHLQQPPPADPFGEESACEQALNLVAAIGRDPSFVTRQQLAAEPVADEEQTALPGGGMLGQYRLLTKLGEGGFGTVYKAVRTRLDKVVALKLLTASRLQNPDAVTRFNREMRAVGKLHHVNIVAAHDAGEIDGTHYLVMELVDGIDLRELVKQRGRLPIGAACELIRQAALGLQHAHEHGLVHRDIKPSNLMLTLPGNHDEAPAVKVLDLGLALLDEDHLENFGELTATGQVMGTLEYMAPEQGADTHAVDIRVDIYSLGASLYKLLTGKAPFSSDQYRSPIKLLMALATQDPPPLITRCPEIPPELEAIVMQMLAKKPHARFATPRELANALAPFSQPADVRALVSFLATTPAGEPVDVNAAEFIGTHAINNPQPRPPVTAAPTTTIKVAASPSRTRTNVRGWTALALTACGLFIAVATYVIRIETDKGELVIHSDHPGISVKVKSNGEEVSNGWTMLKGTDNKQFIRTGQIEIELPAELTGEYTVTPNVVTLTKGKQEIVKIERKETAAPANAVAHTIAPHARVVETKPAPPSPKATTVDRDRVAAEWLVNLGGSGDAIHEITEHPIHIHPTTAIPNARFKLTSAYLITHHLAKPDDLKHLAGLTNLRRLNIGTMFDEDKPSTLDAQRMNYISQIPCLQVLEFQHSQVKTSTLKALNKLPFLRSITIHSKQVDDGWHFVNELRYLRMINIDDHYVPSPADFGKWGQFPQLRRIRLRYNKPLDAMITASLHEQNPVCQTILEVGNDRFRSEQEPVVLGFNPVRAGALTLVAQGFQLSRDHYLGSFDDVTQQTLNDPKKVHLREVNYVKVPQQLPESLDLSGFGQIPLHWLDATDLRGADSFVTKLPTSTVVEEIELMNSDLTDLGLRQLQRLDPFLKLFVQGSKVTQAGIAEFQKARPACWIHSDFGIFEGTFSEQQFSEPSRDVATIDRDREAAQSWIKGGGRCTVILKRNGKEFVVAGDHRLPPAPFELREANVTSENFTEDLQLFAGLTGLQRITIEGNKVDAAVVGILSQIPNLRSIRFRDNQIWTSELAGLGKLPFLHEIAIGTNQVDDDWKFLGNLPNLRSLVVRRYNRPSIADLQKWSEFPQLRTIQLEGASTDEMAATLHEKNPLCRIVAKNHPLTGGAGAGIGGRPLMPRGAGKAGGLGMAGAGPGMLAGVGGRGLSDEVIGVDPVRVGASALLPLGYRLYTDDNRAGGGELTLTYVRDQRSRDPFAVTTVFVPPQAPLTEQALSGLGKLSFIRLNAAGLHQTDTLCKNLPVSLAVEEINLSNSDLTDAGLQHLQRLNPFPVLDVQETKVTRAGIESFRKSNPARQVINDFETPIGVIAVEQIPLPQSKAPVPVDRERAATELWQQRLGEGIIKAGSEIRQFGPHTILVDVPRSGDAPFDLIAAFGSGLKGLTNGDLEHFVGLKRLESLAPWGDGVDAQAVQYLKQMTTLVELDLTGSRIPSSALVELQSLPRLIQLGISGKMVDDQWKFLDQLKGVRKLRISDLQPTAADWQRFQQVPHLREIRFLDDVEVDAAAVAELQQKNPLCRVLSSHPQLRSVGIDPVREAARQLVGHKIFLSLKSFDRAELRSSAAKDAVEDPTPFNVDEIVFYFVNDPPEVDPSKLAPLLAIPFDRLVFRQGRDGSADAFVAALPEELLVQQIRMSKSNLTDRGLLRLSQIARPKRLDMRGTKVTREGVEAFQKAHPDCKVESEF